MSDNNQIYAGRVVAPQGIKGEVRVKTDLADVTLLLKSTPLSITHAKLHKPGLAVVKVQGVLDRNAAETLRGADLYIAREALPDDAVYHHDLIGLNAIDAHGKALGSVVAIVNYGASDLLELQPKSGGDTYFLPFHDEAVEEINLKNKTILLLVSEVI